MKNAITSMVMPTLVAAVMLLAVSQNSWADTLTLVSSDPADGASNVTRSVTPLLNFSAALNRATVAPSRITLHSVAGTQKTSFSVSGEQLKLLPSNTLLPYAHYTIDVSGLRGVGGEMLAAPVSIDFTTRDASWQSATLVERNATYATQPQLAVSANGTAFAMWLQHNGSSFSAWVNRYLPNTGWLQAVALEGAHDFDSFDPTIAADRNGNALALWDRYDGTQWSIWANHYTAGAGWSGAQIITNNTATSSGTIPQVAFDSNGNAIAVWSQYDAGVQSILANRYVAGSGWSTPVVINNKDGASNQLNPKIGFDAQGNAIAIWQASLDGVTLIWANRYVAGGDWGSAQVIQSDQTSSGSSAQLGVDDSGNAIAVWEQAENVYASRYVVNSGWGAATLLNTNSNGFGPQLAINAQGDAFVVWAQVVVSNTTEIPSTRGIIWGNRYTVDGGWEPATLLQSPTGFTADSPQVAIDASGNALAAWNQFNGSVYRIYTTRYQVGNGWGARQLIDVANTIGSFTPQLDSDGSGNVFAVWEQNDSDGSGIQSIWANRFQ